jgi:hypothetical protein
MSSATYPSADPSEISWLHHFWLILGILALACVGLVYFYARQTEQPRPKEIFVAMPVKAMVGESRFVQGKISLVISSAQEKGLSQHQKHIETLVSATLVEMFSGAARPNLAAIRARLLAAINNYLPKRLRVREVLIEDMLIGMG